MQSKRLSRVFSNSTVQKHQLFGAQPSLWSTLTSVHDSWENHSFDYTDLCWQSDVSAFLLLLSSSVIAFLPRSKRLLISWLQSPSAAILEPKKRKSVTASTFSPSICHAVMRNAGLEEAQAGIKFAGRNINNLRYADDTTLMAESEEELRSLLMKVKEESEKVGLKLSIQKTKIMASGPIIS